MIAPHGPFTVSIEFCLTDGDRIAKAGFDLPPGVVPDATQIAEAASLVIGQIGDQLGGTFNWQTRHEFVREILAERAGGVRFSVPGPDEFEAEWAK